MDLPTKKKFIAANASKLETDELKELAHIIAQHGFAENVQYGSESASINLDILKDADSMINLLYARVSAMVESKTYK